MTIQRITSEPVVAALPDPNSQGRLPDADGPRIVDVDDVHALLLELLAEAGPDFAGSARVPIEAAEERVYFTDPQGHDEEIDDPHDPVDAIGHVLVKLGKGFADLGSVEHEGQREFDNPRVVNVLRFASVRVAGLTFTGAASSLLEHVQRIQDEGIPLGMALRLCDVVPGRAPAPRAAVRHIANHPSLGAA